MALLNGAGKIVQIAVLQDEGAVGLLLLQRGLQAADAAMDFRRGNIGIGIEHGNPFLAWMNGVYQQAHSKIR
jgi:hypothetical protein